MDVKKKLKALTDNYFEAIYKKEFETAKQIQQEINNIFDDYMLVYK